MRSTKLDRLLKTVRRLRLLRFALQILLLVICIFLIFKLNSKAADTYLFYHPIFVLVASGGIVLLLAVIAARIYLHDNERSLANELDREHKLKDRLGTYLELRDSSHPFLPALIKESEGHLPPIPIWRRARMHHGSAPPLMLLAILALSVATFSSWPVPQAIAARAEQHRQIAKHSEQFTKKLEKIKKSSTAQEIKKLTEDFLKTLDRINKPDVDPAEALQKMNEMNKQLKDLKLRMEKEQKSAFAENIRSMKDAKGEGTKNQNQDFANEAGELREALEKEGLEGGEEIRQKLESGKLTREDLEKMKKALQSYQEGKKSRDQKMAEIQESLENARKGMTSGKHSVTYNSQLKDRDVEKSKGGVNDGPGTTNKDIGPQHFDTKKKEASTYAEDRTKAEYEQLYSGQRENVGKDPMFLGSRWDAEKSRYVRVRTFGQTNEPQILGGDANTAQQSEAESIIGKEKIPASYRDLIRRYFESIEQ